MNEKPLVPDTLFALPVVVGVTVVLGGLAALVVSGFFVYRAHRVNAETERLQSELQAALQAEQEEAERDAPAGEAEAVNERAASTTEDASVLAAADDVDADVTSATIPTVLLKPGARLQIRRPTHWDQAEIIDILENQQIKVRWLSGEPGEDVIAAELVRGEVLPTR